MVEQADALTHRVLVAIAQRDSWMLVSCGTSNGKFKQKREFTHRSPRRGEVSNFGLLQAVIAESNTSLIVLPPVPPPRQRVSPIMLLTVQRHVNPIPTVLESTVDLSRRFGSWKTFFRDENEILAANSIAKAEVEEEGLSSGAVGDKAKTKDADDADHVHHHHHPDHRRSGIVGAAPQVVVDELPAFVAFFANAVAHRGAVVTCNGMGYTAGGCMWEMRYPDASQWRSVASWVTSPASPSAQFPQISGELKFDVAVPMCDEWCRGYYHFSHEHLPRIALVLPLLMRNPRAVVVFSHDLNGFQRQFVFDIFGVKKEQVVVGTVHAPVVAYPTPMRCGNTFTEALHLLRREVYDAMSLASVAAHNDSEPGRKQRLQFLFAERSKLSRMPRNYFALKTQLTREFATDFDFVTTLGNEHAAQQVRFFYNADVVLGPHGANLANMLFMRPNGHVIEMASMAKGNLCYYATACRIPVFHHLILHQKGKDDAFELEYSLLRRHVAAARDEILSRKIGPTE